MGQFIWKNFPDIPVEYQLINRTKKIKLSSYINEKTLNEKLIKIKKLKINRPEANYLKRTNLFKEDYLEFLKGIKLSTVDINKQYNNSFIIKGNWSEAIYWETFILSTLTELYVKNYLLKNRLKIKNVLREGKIRLLKKIQILKKYPGIKIVDFGTRRRFDYDWQEYVLKTLKHEIPNQLIGTSNVFLAKKLGLKPVGTFAHELYMGFSGIFHKNEKEILSSHNKVLKMWWDYYGKRLSIALTDNYGVDFFFKDFSLEQAKKWIGLRHDSGDPIIFCEKAIRFYRKCGLDPKTKTIIFSNSLSVNIIIKIYNHFKGKINTIFGWGTDLTNDFGIEIPSLVIKITDANRHKVVKFTDDLSKTTGDKKDIEKYSKIFLV